MKMLTARTLLMTSLLVSPCLPARAADYRGVEVGQRADYLPPEFDEVVRGEYEARFGKERMQVFSAGALVQAFKVIPLAPMTLAEALARHSPSATETDLRALVNFNGVFLALADANNRIAYFTQSIRGQRRSRNRVLQRADCAHDVRGAIRCGGCRRPDRSSAEKFCKRNR